jgi:uncharacterized protein
MPVLHLDMTDAAPPVETPPPAAPASPEPTSPVPEAPGPEPARQLDPRFVPLNKRINAIVGTVISIVHFVTCLVTSAWPYWAIFMLVLTWIPATAGLVWLAVRWPEIDYRHRRYKVDAQGIEIWSGVVWRETVAIPRSRVQHIDVSQGPLERSYGLATLSIHTAGTHYSKVDLPGLAHPIALELRDALLPQDAEPAV